MPKVPQVFSSGDTGGTPGGARLNPEGFAHLATSGTRAVAGVIGQQAQSYQQIYQTLRAEDEQLDAERGLAEAQKQFADADIQLKNDPAISAEQYPQEVERQLRTIRDGVGKSLKYPGSRLLFERGIERFNTQQVIKAKYDGLERLHAEVKASTGIALRDDTNAAVAAPTPELQQQGLDRGLARINSLLQRRIISGDEANAWNTRLLADVEQGRIRRDVKNPVLAPGILANLRTGNVYTTLSPEAQHDLANNIETELRQEDERQTTARKEAEAAVASEAEKGIYDAVQAGNWNVARGFLSSARKFIPADKYKEYGELIANREGKGAPSDPDTKRALNLSVFSLENDPRAELAKVQRAYGANPPLLDDADYQRFATHLEARISKGEDKQLAALGREHQQAEQLVGEWTRVPAGIGSMFLSDQAQNIKAMALEDLTRNSAYFGKGNEPPLVWANRRKAFYLSQLDSLVRQRLSDIDRQLQSTARQVGLPIVDAATLARSRTVFRNEADYYDAVRLLKESTQIRAYQQSFRAGAPPSTAAGSSGPVTPTAATSGNPLGR